MDEQKNEVIITLREKIRQIIGLYEKTKEEKRTLEQENVDLQEKVKFFEKEKEIIKQKYNTLKLAKAISNDDDDAHDAKLKVNKIVREIDKCIALLNK